MRKPVRTLVALFRCRPKPLPVTSRQTRVEQERQQRIEELKEEGVMTRARLAIDAALVAERIEVMQEIADYKGRLVQADPELRPVLDAMEADFVRKLTQVQRLDLRRLD